MDDVSVILYASHYEAIKDLIDEEKGRLLDAIFAYAKGGTPQFHLTDSEGVKMAFSFIKIQMDIDKRKYTEKCERNKANARKRWERTDAVASDGMHNDNENENKDKNENENNNEDDNGNDNPNHQKEETKKGKPKIFSEEEKRQITEISNAFNFAVKNTAGCKIKGIRMITDARAKKIFALLQKFSREEIFDVFKQMAASNYLNARTNELKRPADVDWLLEVGNFTKALEGSF